jgi:hypothetical protein
MRPARLGPSLLTSQGLREGDNQVTKGVAKERPKIPRRRAGRPPPGRAARAGSTSGVCRWPCGVCGAGCISTPVKKALKYTKGLLSTFRTSDVVVARAPQRTGLHTHSGSCRTLSEPRYYPQLTTGKPTPEKKASVVTLSRALRRPPFERRACASCRDVDLKAALLAETRARGPDGSRMRSPQLARCSRDQLRRRMGQHGAALARGEAAGVRYSERRRAWADSSKRASEPDAQSRVREHGGRRTTCHGLMSR